MNAILLAAAGIAEGAGWDGFVVRCEEVSFMVLKWLAGRTQRDETGPAEQHFNRGVCYQMWCVGRPAIAKRC